MASANNQMILSSINLVDMDFNSLKTSFKNYLRGQDRFKDYDFEGPNMTILLEIMAYNTFKNAFYTNMAISESHLDSAQLRSSVVSNAKDLNYVPRSIRSSRARIRVDFDATGESAPYTIPKGSEFSTLVKNTSYTFTLPESLVVTSANNTYSFTTDIYEGVYVQDIYVMGNQTRNQRFRISNRNVDTRSLVVTVLEDNAQVGDIYKIKTTLLDLNSKSKVFFLQASVDGYYEILFGDNILGRKPKVGSTIIIDYRISNGAEGDSAKIFSCDFDPTGADELTETPLVTTLESSRNGDAEEDIESIRYYAPRAFQVQERTVIDIDYETILKTQFPEINVVSAYGGETLTPPKMGKTIIAVDINNVDGLPESKKQEYTRFLNKRSPFGSRPVFVEPEYLFLNLEALVRFDPNITDNSPERIKALVTSVLVDYNDTNLNDFNSTLRFSALGRAIDFADKSIVSNITNLSVYKKLPVQINTPYNYVVDFNLAFDKELARWDRFGDNNIPSIISSTTFRFRGILVTMKDDVDGNIILVQKFDQREVYVATVGRVNYDIGRLTFTNLNIEEFIGAALKIYAVPDDIDVRSDKNTILTLEQAGINIEVEEIR